MRMQKGWKVVGTDEMVTTKTRNHSISAVATKELSKLDIAHLNHEFESFSPHQILSWCINNILDGLIQTTSFSTLPITHIIYRELGCRIPVVFIDTLHLFPETLETAYKAQEIYDLDLRIYRAKEVSTKEAFAERYGESLWAHDVSKFHALTKVEPFNRALDELDVTAWITGRRRDQSEERHDMPIIELDHSGRLKINPLANWSRKQLWSYIVANQIPYNPLHDKGYASIGDQPLTTPIFSGEAERSGRWRGSSKTECGLHL